MLYFPHNYLNNVCEDPSKESRYAPRGLKTKFYKRGASYYREEISKAELESFRGTNQLIGATWCGCRSVYEITAVEEGLLPKLINYEKKGDFKSYEEVTEEYATLKELYQQKQNEINGENTV